MWILLAQETTTTDPGFWSNLLSFLPPPWNVILPALVVAFFPLKNRQDPRRGEFMFQRLLKMFQQNGQPGLPLAPPASTHPDPAMYPTQVVANAPRQFADCQDAIKYLADCASGKGDDQLRDKALELLRPFADLAYKDQPQQPQRPVQVQ
jgi:hypothetical protein